MSFVKLTLTPASERIERTAEIDAWLKEAEDKIEAEVLKRFENLVIFGTSHPDYSDTPTPGPWADLFAAPVDFKV